MMKFFRTIRQKLLPQKKYSQYFFYAIGEILLVVVGILIALQINNWHQVSQNKKLEAEYLKGIEMNLSDDIAELRQLFTTDTLKFDAYTFLVRTLNGANYSTQKQAIAANLFTVARLSWFEGQNVVFEDLKYSGKLTLIQSDSIRHAIQIYYRFFEEVVKQEALNNAQIVIYKDRFAQKIKMSPLIESTFPEAWNGNLVPVDLAFMDTPKFREDRAYIIENFSQIKSWQMSSHGVRVKFYAQAVALKKLIERYLETVS